MSLSSGEIETRNSHQLYHTLPVTRAGTISQIASEYGFESVESGTGFYQLGNKSEEVSGAKELVIQQADGTYIDGTDEVRKLLKQSAGTKIKLSAKQFEGLTIWIQSTSANRGLLADTTLLIKGRPKLGGAPAAAGKPTAAKRKAATSSATVRHGGDGDGEDEVEEDEPKAKKSKKTASASAPSVSVPVAIGSVTPEVSPSGRSYTFYPVNMKATIGEILGSNDAGIYQMYQVTSKKESISPGKELVLVDSNGRIIEDTIEGVRGALKLGKGTVTVNDAAVTKSQGAGARLFVQSTSGNRNLLPGSTLCVCLGGGVGGGGSGGAPIGVSLAQLFAARGAAADSSAGTKKKGRRDEDEGDDGDEDMDGGGDGDGDGDDDGPTLSKHNRISKANADLMRAKFLSESKVFRWENASGTQFVIRAIPDRSLNFDHYEDDDWPKVWYGEDSQLVNAAMWVIESKVLKLVGVWTFSGGDETNIGYLEKYSGDVMRFEELAENTQSGRLDVRGGGNHKQRVIDADCCDAFGCSSGDEAITQFRCPALEELPLSAAEATAATPANNTSSSTTALITGSWSPDGARSYTFYPIHQKATISQLMSQRNHPASKLPQYYELFGPKKESISPKKELVLYDSNGNTILADTVEEVRKRLKVGLADTLNLNAADVSRAVPGAKLFVQSTSSNRNLIPGTSLCVRTSESSGNSPAVGMLPVPGGKSKKSIGGDDDDEDMDGGDDDDGDDESGGGGGGPLPPLPSPFTLVLPFIQWSKLIGCEDGGRSDLFPPNSPWSKDDHIRGFCDENIPKRLQQRALDLLKKLKDLGDSKYEVKSGSITLPVGFGNNSGTKSVSTTQVQDGWYRDSQLEAKIASEIWREHGKSLHRAPTEASLVVDVHAHVHSRAPASDAIISIELNGEFNDTDGVFLLVTSGPQWILIGCPGAHPMIETNDFSYGNSDGSGPDLIISPSYAASEYAPKGVVATNLDSAPELLAIVTRYFKEFSNDNYH